MIAPPPSALLFFSAWTVAVARRHPQLLIWLASRVRPEARAALHWLALYQIAYHAYISEPARCSIVPPSWIS